MNKTDNKKNKKSGKKNNTKSKQKQNNTLSKTKKRDFHSINKKLNLSAVKSRYQNIDNFRVKKKNDESNENKNKMQKRKIYSEKKKNKFNSFVIRNKNHDTLYKSRNRFNKSKETNNTNSKILTKTNTKTNTNANANKLVNIKVNVQKDDKNRETYKRQTYTERKANKANRKNFIIKNIKDLHNTSVKSKNKNNPELQKTLTAYKDPNAKKFNEEEFQQLMKNFDEWDKKKKEKIEKLKKEKEEEEMKLLKDQPETNKEENLKFNTNPKNYNIIERLYEQDIKKRKDKKLILTQIYTPPFKPQIHIDKNVLNKALERSRNNNKFRLIKRYYHTDENTVDDEVYMEDSQDNNNENEENEENEEKDDSEEDSEIFKNMKNVNYSERNRKNRNIKLIKNFKTEEESDEEDNANKKDRNKNANKEKNNIIIEFRLRNLLFRKKKPVRRNKSSEKRKRVGFNIDD